MEIFDNKEKGKGLRLNEGKVRIDLVPESAIRGIANVMTFGAKKYAPNNWRKGMAWSNVTSSLKRHLAAIDRGEDFDPESGLYHIDHVLCNAAFLKEYYKIYPEGDDRQHLYLRTPKIGLDIDEVLADWVGHWCRKFNMERPKYWTFDRDIKTKFEEMKNDKDFWMSIPPLVNPKELPFEPHCYITSRSIPQEWTEQWLNDNEFPGVPVYSIPHGHSKVEIAKQAGVEWFVDDRFENFVDLNRNGICCFLFDAPHNQKYDVGFKRIKDLKELVVYE